MSIETMKLALEALESESPDIQLRAAIALRAAIEQAEKQEPVGYFSINDYGNYEQNESDYGTPLYTAPPQREWQGLTDEDLSVCDEDGVILARYWEAKLKEKNT